MVGEGGVFDLVLICEFFLILILGCSSVCVLILFEN